MVYFALQRPLHNWLVRVCESVVLQCMLTSVLRQSSMLNLRPQSVCCSLISAKGRCQFKLFFCPGHSAAALHVL